MLGLDEKLERTSTVAVSRGLLVVRYASSGADRDFPIALVRPSSRAERAVEVISAPGARQGLLEKPGDCLVVRVHEPASLEIGVRRATAGGSLDASFQIDVLDGGRLPEASRAAAEPYRSAVDSDYQDYSVPRPVAAASVAPQTKAHFSVLAHVAMRGDVEGRPEMWIAGPNAPAPIEGLAIRCEDPARLGVEIQALIAGSRQWTDWAPPGAFAGSRGRGLPLVAVRLRLSGSDAAWFELFAEALFLGSTAVARSGRQIEFSSTTGSDPLVGLKLGVRTAERPPNAEKEGPWRDRGSRVRVFRSATTG